MNWQELKQKHIQNMRTIVVKVGSAVLTNEQGIDRQVLENIVSQLSTLVKEKKRVVLVSSGAVAAGRAALRTNNTDESFLEGLSGKQAAAAIGQGRLVHLYDEAFAKHSLLSAQILLTRLDFKNRERFLNARNTLMKLLDMQVIPIINENDTVSVNELKFGDNDALASYILNAVEGDLIINLTSTGGVLSKNPLKAAKNERIPLIPCINDIDTLDLDLLCGGKSAVGTGGMYSKLLSARRAAQLNVPTYILAGKKENIILDALKENPDNPLGTWVIPSQNHISRKKYWLAYKSEPHGTLHVDQGAAKALLEQGKSLLPAGIISVEGDFKEGDIVRIVHDSKAFAVGLINYSSEDMQRIAGKKRLEVAVLLGNAHYPEVIHRDNMLLNAAV